MNIRQELASQAAEVLEPNLQFYRSDPSDKNRYLVGPEVLNAISWAATAIGLPILLSGVNEIIKDRVQQWLKDWRNKKMPHVEPPDALQQELGKLLESKGGIAITSDQVSDATNAIASYLSYRGWPTALAREDATAIVELIRTKVEKGK